MTNEQLAEIKKEFKRYCRGFRPAGGGLPPMLKLKYEHSRRVAAEARALSSDLAWLLSEQNAAEALGILHDIGRFSQFAEYKTFADADSMDHGEAGWLMARQSEWTSPLPAEEHDAVLTGIRYHNRCAIPEHLSGTSLRFLRLIRDADKLDIFRVVLDTLEREAFYEILKMFPGVSEGRSPSPELINEAQFQKSVSFSNIRNIGDFLVMQILWMYDLNYVATLKRVLERDILNRLFGQLDGDLQTRGIKADLDRFIRQKL